MSKKVTIVMHDLASFELLKDALSFAATNAIETKQRADYSALLNAIYFASAKKDFYYRNIVDMS